MMRLDHGVWPDLHGFEGDLGKNTKNTKNAKNTMMKSGMRKRNQTQIMEGNTRWTHTNTIQTVALIGGHRSDTILRKGVGKDVPSIPTGEGARTWEDLPRSDHAITRALYNSRDHAILIHPHALSEVHKWRGGSIYRTSTKG